MRRGVVAAIVALAFVLAAATAARADTVDARGVELRTGQPFKVRLSAALWLSKRPAHDGRAIGFLADALLREKESTVRRVAALALGKLVAAETPSGPRARALSALAKAAAGDRDREVRRNAKASLASINERLPVAGSDDDGHVAGVHVHIGDAVDLSRKLSAVGKRDLVAVVRGTLARGAPHYGMSGSDQPAPSGAELRGASQRGFYLGASVAQLSSAKAGRMVEVRCKVSLRITPWSGRDGGERLTAEQTASASGSGRVRAPSRDLARAQAECVTAVAEEVTTRQVVPFLRRFEGRANR